MRLTMEMMVDFQLILLQSIKQFIFLPLCFFSCAVQLDSTEFKFLVDSKECEWRCCSHRHAVSLQLTIISKIVP